VYSISACVADAAGNLGTTSASRSFILDTTALTATSVRDSLTGTASADTFFWPTLSSSLLSAYDTVTNYAAGDQISVDGNTYGDVLTGLRGQATALNATAINTTLGGTGFAANTALVFTVSGISNGSFLALNDAFAGYQSGSDAIIFLENFTPTPTNPISVL
jgi:hypothetical protein